jgi:hypothetical protein
VKRNDKFCVLLTARHLEMCCNDTNLTHCLSSVYSVTTPLQVSVLLVAHLQEAAMYICDSWYVLCVLVDCRWAWMEWNCIPSNGTAFHPMELNSIQWNCIPSNGTEFHPMELHPIQWNRGVPKGGFGGFKPPPKFRSFAKAEPNSQFRGIYVHP